MSDKDKISADNAESSELKQTRETKKSRRRRRKKRKHHKHCGSFDNYLRFLERLEADTDGAAGALVSSLGIIPAFAAGESMMSQAQAQGIMMANQVANQQRVNTIAMATTVACVSDMMHLPLRHHHHRGDDPVYNDHDEPDY